MNNKIIESIEKEQKKADRSVNVGETVKVDYMIVEGDKERVQGFEGVVIAKHLGNHNSKATFTVRRVNQGYAVERVFPLHSPRIQCLRIVKRSKVRRAKLYYLRKLKGKAARLKEKMN